MVILACPDAAGRLRVLRKGGQETGADPGGSRDLGSTFRDGRARRSDIGDGSVVATLPLTVDGRTVGVLQVVAAGLDLDRGSEVLELIAARLAEQSQDRAPAEEPNRQLDMGIAWSAHEMRGPILGVRAALETLLGRVQDTRDAALLRGSLAELERLAATSDAMLELAAGTSGPEVRPTDVVSLVHEATDSVRLETGEDRIVVHAPAAATARVDPPYLRTAVVNLLRNAIVYSDPGTEVQVTLEAGDEVVDLSVRNEGSGIPPEERESIFAPFVRGRSVVGTKQGRGLGLSIAWRAIEAQGGRIWVDPEGPGATFRVTVPAEEGGRPRVAS